MAVRSWLVSKEQALHRTKLIIMEEETIMNNLKMMTSDDRMNPKETGARNRRT